MAKTAIITGGAHGIGRECVKVFARAGYNVLINYNNSKADAQALASGLCAEGLSAAAYRADVSKREEAVAMASFCFEKFGSAEVLVNNAGLAQSKLFTDITEADWEMICGVNLKGVFNCCQAFLPHMIAKKHGRIINISSVWGITGASCEVHYSAAKAGVIGLTKALAKETAPSGITVNCVAPGVIDTRMLGGFSADEIAALTEEIPVGRLGTPNDVAQCVMFLANAGYVTGQVVGVDGGFAV